MTPSEDQKNDQVPELTEEAKASILQFKSLADLHIKTAKEIFNKDLEMNEEAFGIIDEMINTGDVEKTEENLGVIILTVGSFLGELLIATLGGKWDQNEENNWIININGTKVSTFQKVANVYSGLDEQPIQTWYEDLKSQIG